MILQDGLRQLAASLKLDAAALIAFAQEDRIGGFNLDVNQRRWPTGSIWEVEGQVLYALVRALRPETVVEIGTWYGCGATHILEAMAVNGSGKLISIDINPAAGQNIPLSLRSRWQFVNAKGQDYMASGALPKVDMVFEDGPHDIEETALILSAAREFLKPRLTISHDGMHFNVGASVREAHRRAFDRDPQTLLIEPSDCGFAYFVNGGK